MKVMKARKPHSRAMKVMAKPMKTVRKPSKIARGKRAYWQVMSGRKEKTSKGLTNSDLKKNKYGKIVSFRRSAHCHGNLWIKATVEARRLLGTVGFCPCGGDTPNGKALLDQVRVIYTRLKDE